MGLEALSPLALAALLGPDLVLYAHLIDNSFELSLISQQGGLGGLGGGSLPTPGAGSGLVRVSTTFSFKTLLTT